MPKINHSVEVFVPRDELFKVSTDFENLPSVLQNFKSVKILSRENNTIVTEDEVILMNHFCKQKVKHTLFFPEKHTAEIISGEAEGSFIEEVFEETPNGTRVIINADFKLKGKLKLIGFAVKNKIKLALESTIYEFSDLVENKMNKQEN